MSDPYKHKYLKYKSKYYNYLKNNQTGGNFGDLLVDKLKKRNKIHIGDTVKIIKQRGKYNLIDKTGTVVGVEHIYSYLNGQEKSIKEYTIKFDQPISFDNKIHKTFKGFTCDDIELVKHNDTNLDINRPSFDLLKALNKLGNKYPVFTEEEPDLDILDVNERVEELPTGGVVESIENQNLDLLHLNELEKIKNSIVQKLKDPNLEQQVSDKFRELYNNLLNLIKSRSEAQPIFGGVVEDVLSKISQQDPNLHNLLQQIVTTLSQQPNNPQQAQSLLTQLLQNPTYQQLTQQPQQPTQPQQSSSLNGGNNTLQSLIQLLLQNPQAQQLQQLLQIQNPNQQQQQQINNLLTQLQQNPQIQQLLRTNDLTNHNGGTNKLQQLEIVPPIIPPITPPLTPPVNQQNLSLGGGVNNQQLKLYDRVRHINPKEYSSGGTIIQLWGGSQEESMTGRYGLSKYKIKFDDDRTAWLYNSDLTKI